MAVEKPALSCIAGGNTNGAALVEGFCQYLTKPNMHLPFVLGIPLLGIYLEGLSPTIQK